MSVVSILTAIFIFGILIFIHEFGHFLIARKNSIRVLEFSVGMGPVLFSFGKKSTKYSIRLLPFGGYCRMQGFEDEQIDDEANGELNAEDSFVSKSVWARLSVAAAGAIFNFLLAFVLAVILIGAAGYDPARVISVTDGSPAAEAGLKEGDIIIGFNGSGITFGRELMLSEFFKPIESSDAISVKYRRDGIKNETKIIPKLIKKYAVGMQYTADDSAADIERVVEGSALDMAGIKEGDVIISADGNVIKSARELSEYISANPFTDKPVTFTINRGGDIFDVLVTPQYTDEFYSLGFSYNTGREKTGVLGVLKYSLFEVKYQIGTVFKCLGLIFKGRLTINDFSGPVGMTDIINDTYKASRADGVIYVIYNMINLTIMLSANLGVMNLLPIPGLDGGRMLFLLIEAVRRKPIDRKKEGIIHVVGMLFLMAFAIYVLFHDITLLFK